MVGRLLRENLMVIRLLRENQKTIPKYLRSKTLFKTVTLQILNFILVS